MGWFERKEPTETLFNSLDLETLSALGAGSDLTRPRDWTHYIYCADEPGAWAIAAAASQGGWDLRDVGKASSGSGWVVIAEQRDIIVTSKTVWRARAFFEQLATSVPGGDYDGWEASV